MKDSDLLPFATEFEFYPEGAGFDDREVFYFAVKVARRSNNLWAVLWLNQCWNHVTQDWEYEPRDRSKKFLAECRLPFDEAVRIARCMPDTLTVNGKTWADFKTIHALQERQAHVDS
ncbi:hypothetical protein Achl_4360 (plasmid) [Pseudarthrobacter chlorophenolicus A6]|uniref:Uncharacterized protein n=1 Tax=Pseudarthrobacter chlorophenolicus (strain ATCC 700700 / DSM 12829 / CIP 107037 / JCM 12360 / KCTC 9906 / NCIMB 13794 / A6) TaxID=452863 RepID=B8HIR4_PSECP|nr:hypothetical protein [Pseudarthrobacter chlorophenolicus]ACL42311.1 hypothetical protein Achl_4360 [Pseudarthrobacter chlorophenolicus A6]SDQ16330.1 hypothetical protein SAMN04489738_0417 [Pseudarthrobacter chlorophenolicus]